MKLAIVIPIYVNTLAHQNYLIETTRSINTTHEWVFIPVVNKRPQFVMKSYQFTKQPSKIIELEGRQPQSVARAWNDGISKSAEEGCAYTLVINSDIILEKVAINSIIAYAELNKGKNIMWTMTEHNLPEKLNAQKGKHYSSHPDFAAFLVRGTFSDLMGKFDENFTPAYFEDVDMFARITKLKREVAICPHAKFFHYGSTTINADPDYSNGHASRFGKNWAYFRRKWGHEPIWTKEEVLELYYKAPFNKSELDTNSW